MKRLLLPACLGVAVLVVASGPLRSAGSSLPPSFSEPDERRSAAPAPGEDPARVEQEARLARAELLAGLTPVEGPGLAVTLRNSPRKPPRGFDRSNLLLHSRDVNAVLNALRAAGAEALAVAGIGQALPERVTNNTVAVGGKGGFLVNGTELKSPLRLLVIGNVAALRAELARKDGALRGAGLDVLEMVEIANAPLLRIPAARHLTEFRFARVSSGESPAQVAVRPMLPERSVAVTKAPGEERPAPVKPPVVAEASPLSSPAARVAEKTPPTTTAISPDGGPASAPAPARVSEPTPGKAVSGQPVLSASTAPQPRKEPVVVAIAPRAKQPPPPVGARSEPRPPVETVSGPVFGGKGLAKYHVPGCRFGERIGRLERVTFVSPEEARAQGRKPCSVCCGNQ